MSDADTRARCLVRGSINIDEFFHVNSIVRPGETISSSMMEQRAGGKGANQAVAVSKAGGAIDLIGAIGDDGQWVYTYLKSLGVNVRGVEIVKENTGRAIIQLTDEGENCIILFKGANFTKLRPPTYFHPNTTHLLLQNEVSYSSTIAYMNFDSGRPVTRTFNPSPMPTPVELAIFPWKRLGWLLVNEVEAVDLYKVLTKSSDPPPSPPPPPTSDASARYLSFPVYPYAYALAEILPGNVNVVCTVGPDGVLALTAAPPGSAEREPVIYLPAARLRGPPKDSTGAGDCFTGYLVTGLMELEDIRLKDSKTPSTTEPFSREETMTVLRRAVQASAMCVERRGAMDSIPLRADVEKRLQG